MTSLTRRRPHLISIKLSDAEYTKAAMLASLRKQPLATMCRDLIMEQADIATRTHKPTEFKHGYTSTQHANRYPPAEQG